MSDSSDTKQCSNCKLDILTSNYTIHSVHCQRNFYFCSQCEQPVNYKNKAKHDKTNHAVVHCSNCQLALEKYLYEDHLINSCPDRKVKCQICDIEVKVVNITEHENYCGSRTEKCSECGEFVMLKYKSLHIDSNHTFVKLSDEPGPSPSWQHGRRTLCNFMPDLSSKTASCKPSSIHKSKLNEHTRKSIHLGSSESKDDFDEIFRRNMDSAISEKKDSQFDYKMSSAFDVKDVKKSTKKDVDEWPALSSLRLLQISEDQKDVPTGSQAGNWNQVDEDLMFAIKVSQEINSDIWNKDINKEDEPLNNCLKSSVKNETPKKLVEKNTFEKKQKKINDEPKVDTFKNDFNYFYDKHESVKLPCEFCGTLIVSNDLFLHQSRCSLYMTESYNLGSEKYKTPYFDEDMEKKIACGVCNKFFRLSVFENHMLHCQKTPAKLSKYKVTSSKNLKAMNMKCEQGLQNGLELSSPQLTRMGTRSEWLSELSKNYSETGRDVQNNLDHPEPMKGVVAKTTKVSRKNRRAPSPPRR